MIRTYLETIAELPWNTRTEEQIDLKHAAKVLEEDHYGLEDVKDRVLEFLAVRQLQLQRDGRDARRASRRRRQWSQRATATPTRADAAVSKGSTESDGKDQTTAPNRAAARSSSSSALPASARRRSRGRSRARPAASTTASRSAASATRRTSAATAAPTWRRCPGRIIQGLKQVGSKNPVFVLDEVDKLSVSFQGNPASALLEVLDPAQNDSFTDHYLGVPFDLSEVLFVATANFVQNIPAPLLDRMEMVDFSGYTEQEKKAIARQYLVPRQLADNGLTTEQIEITDSALEELISRYTREAGVRQLERVIGSLARKVARRIAAGEVARDDGRARAGGRRSWAGPRSIPSTPPIAIRWASPPACSTRRWAATSCSSRSRRCAARAS